MLPLAARPRDFQIAALALAALIFARPAVASCSDSASAFDPCFDANALWLPAGKAAFVSLPDTQASPLHSASLGFAAELYRGAVRLHAPSPDSGGRDVQVVDYAADASLLFAFGLLHNLELTAAVPFRVYQNGAGASGITSQAGPPLTESALRDPRLSIAYSLDQALAVRNFGTKLELDLSLPLAKRDTFAGSAGFVAGPAGTVSYAISRFALRAGLGLRLRRSVDFGGVKLGSQAFAALGIGVDALSPGALFFALEAFALPSLTAGASPLDRSVSSATLLPAEWLASASTNFRGGPWSLRVAGGTGLPLSSERRSADQGATVTHFLGLTSPEFRTLLSVRFTPQDEH